MKILLASLLLSLAFISTEVQAFNPPNETFSFSFKKEFYPVGVVMFEESIFNYFAVTSNPSELFRSLDGNSWTAAGNLPINTVFSVTSDPVGDIYISGRNYTGLDSAVFKSSDGGFTWTQSGAIFADITQLKIKFLGNALYAWNGQRAWRLDNNMWTQVFQSQAIPVGNPVDLIEADSIYIVYNTPAGTKFANLVTGTEAGGLPGPDAPEWHGGQIPRYITYYEGYYYLTAEKQSGASGSIWRSSNGASWEKVQGITGNTFVSIHSKPGQGIFAVTNLGIVLRSWTGTVWTAVTYSGQYGSGYDVLATSEPHMDFFAFGTRIYKSTSNAWPDIGVRYWVGNVMNGNVSVGNATDIQLSLLDDKESDIPVTAIWKQVGGPAVAISDPTNIAASFTPTQAGEYIFELAIKDSFMSPSDVGTKKNLTVNATALYSPPQQNQPPMVNVEPNKTCTVNQTCSITAVVSDPDGDPLTYEWSHADVQPNNSPNAAVVFGQAGVYTRTLYVYDTYTTHLSSDSITITVVSATTNQIQPPINSSDQTNGVPQIQPRPPPQQPQPPENQPPVLDVLEEIEGEVGVNITLQSLAVDPEGGAVSYSWQQIGGEEVNLSNTTERSTTFAARVPGLYTFQIAATDGDGKQSVKTVLARIRGPEEPPPQQPAIAELVSNPVTLGGVIVIIIVAGLAAWKFKCKKGKRR